jgi:hypothetical protein
VGKNHTLGLFSLEGMSPVQLSHGNKALFLAPEGHFKSLRYVHSDSLLLKKQRERERERERGRKRERLLGLKSSPLLQPAYLQVKILSLLYWRSGYESLSKFKHFICFI